MVRSKETSSKVYLHENKSTRSKEPSSKVYLHEKIINTERLKELTNAVGKDRLVLDLSCRRRDGSDDKKYYVVTDRWQKYTDFAVTKKNLIHLANYCDEFLVHGVDVEGTKTGIDEDLVILLGQICPIPVTYAGGAKDISDLDRVMRLGKGRVALTIGSALDIFGGTTKYSDVVKWCKLCK